MKAVLKKEAEINRLQMAKGGRWLRKYRNHLYGSIATL